MDFTKGKVFVGFRHTEDRNTYWLNLGWQYDQEVPGLFPYNSKEEKATVNEVFQSLSSNWKLKDVEKVILRVDGVEQLKIESDVNVKRRGRKPKNTPESS